MDIERLKELADCDVFIGGNPIVVDSAQETLRTLIDEAIARQSVKSEDVAEAIQPWVSVEDEKPESGKHVLLCCEIRPSGKRYVCDGYYAASKSITSGYSSEWDCEYDEETDKYYLPEGYYEVVKNWDDYSSIVIDDFVTHWKPLPEPPKGE